MSTLVGGIGNVFLGDDGFGIEVVRRLAARPQRNGVQIADFGIRSFDLAYALVDGYDDVILVDAVPQGRAPGTLSLIEPALAGASSLDTHAFAPHHVLAWLPQLGGKQPSRLRIVGCEPGDIPVDGEVHVGLSAPVAAAVERAVDLVEDLLQSRLPHGG